MGATKGMVYEFPCNFPSKEMVDQSLEISTDLTIKNGSLINPRGE